ncbi:hypothetical protein ACQ4PT_065288 [Festuca glaucescens]
MVLLFILVIIRCFQKAMYLKSGSFNALREDNSSKVNMVQGRDEEGLDNFVQEAKDIMNLVEPLGTPVSPSLPYQLFLDFPCSYSDRLTMVRNFRSLEHESAFDAIEEGLSAMTSFLYTKDDDGLYLAFTNATAPVIFRLLTSTLAQAMIPAANVLLLTHAASMADTGHKKGYIGLDARFTAVLLHLTLGLEVVYACVQFEFRDKFSGKILQRSIIGLLAHNRRHSMLRRIAGWLWCKDLLEGFWCGEPSYSCKEITELVRLHVETGWREHIREPYSYRMFNDTRGEWTLARNGCLQQLGWSIRRPFDESTILWHLATDLYIHHTSTSPDDHVSSRRCKEMSNYMVHLLSDNPDMLISGSRKRLLETADKELEVLLEGEWTQLDKNELTRRIFEKCGSAACLSQDTPSLIGDAWKLAQSLLTVDETRIWELIQGVWVEMLCFSASRCRGYLHAEALGTGVEYLSYVWVQLAYTGMETFAEKLQRRERNSFDSDEALV